MSFLGRFYLVFSWALVIFILISVPMPEYEGYEFTYYDKAVHIFLFGILAYLIIYALISKPAVKKRQLKLILIISILASILYAGLSEYTQIFVPGRDVNIFDFLAGVLGILIAQLYAYKKFSSEA